MANCISCAISILVFLMACAHLGTSLRCYECKSQFNGDCDNVKGKKLPDETCEHSKLVKAFPDAGTEYVCVVHTMVQKDDAELSVVRGCAPDNYCSYFEGSNECLTCKNDLCNSSSSVLPSIVLSIVGILCAKYYF